MVNELQPQLNDEYRDVQNLLNCCSIKWMELILTQFKKLCREVSERLVLNKSMAPVIIEDVSSLLTWQHQSSNVQKKTGNATLLALWIEIPILRNSPFRLSVVKNMAVDDHVPPSQRSLCCHYKGCSIKVGMTISHICLKIDLCYKDCWPRHKKMD